MNSLKEIYVAYEIGDIYPENLPALLLTTVDEKNRNELLQEIIKLKKPTRGDIYEFLPEAFGISEKEKLTKLEKLDLLINRWFYNKLSSIDLKSRMVFFELEDVYFSKSYDEFMVSLNTTIGGTWIPSDQWDWVIKNFIEDFKIENRYADFLLRES